MIFCIDCGNTRIKWGAYNGQKWLAQGAVAHTNVAELTNLTDTWQPTAVCLASVAGSPVTQSIRDALIAWQALISDVKTSAGAAGVFNGYENPAQLGVDRWLAMIGARGISPAACLVVMAGTATTIDTLAANGHFLGGLILPGLDLMRQSLARDTAALPLANGEHKAFPRNTHDAIISGCIEAQLGAIERAFRQIAGEPNATCLISGGNAEFLASQLTIPHRRVENLVLEGLARYSMT